MAFLSRLFLPLLNAELRQTNAKAIWWEQQAREGGLNRLKIEAELRAEVRRNRKREDDLVNQIVALGGGRPLAKRFDDAGPIESDTADTKLSATDESILLERAKDYCQQTITVHEVTQADIDTAMEMMLKDPAYWLKD